MNNSNTLWIGITPRKTTVYGSEAYYCNKAYIDYLKQADSDVLCFLLPLAESETEAMQYTDMCDGLIIDGGADINPELYDEENQGSEGCYDLCYDQSDLFLYHAFLNAGKPILGICRGIQMINVAEGGTLIQDIPSLTGVIHQQLNMEPPKGLFDKAHRVKTVSGTLLGSLVNSTIEVNSFHHQAIDTLGNNLNVSAYSEDGLIEAIENEQVLAVQWHPERLLHDPLQIRIAAAFLSRCRSAKQSAE